MKRWMGMLFASMAASVAAAEPGAEDSLASFIDTSRKMAAEIVRQIGGELRKELDASGPLRAVIVCKYTAPEVASNLSRMTGMRVTRVSLKPRNPALGLPDPWEQKVLADFDRRVAAGHKPEQLEYWELVTEPQGRFLRYMKAIPTQKLCLTCHGPLEGITDAVKAQIANEYPYDRATGFREGSVRGAVSVKKFLD